MTTEEIIKQEVINLIQKTKESVGEIKTLAIGEAWKILQLLTAAVIQIIEKIGTDLSGIEKKKIAMDSISQFYDAIFNVIDLPFLPGAIESLLHEYVKKILMMLVDSAIDAMVATFRDVGVFVVAKTSSLEENVVVEDFVKNLNNIVRQK